MRTHVDIFCLLIYYIRMNILFAVISIAAFLAAAVFAVLAIRSRILRLCGERGISVNRLVNLSAVPPNSIKNILYGKSNNPKLMTIKLICDGLGITLGEFFSCDEFDKLEQSIK